MEDLIPIETVLADMESDCGIVAEAAKDYLNIHRDEYRGDRRVKMTEYITKEEACKECFTVQTKKYGSIEVVPVDYIASIEAADVQPVKRGRWIISNIYAQCSECSVAYDLDTFQRLIPMNENVPRHCSYCGADMRGEAENDT